MLYLRNKYIKCLPINIFFYWKWEARLFYDCLLTNFAGSDPWCLDKNYAGVLIIWDRMFGTFQAERTDAEITYGLVKQPKTLNIIHLQVCTKLQNSDSCLYSDLLDVRLSEISVCSYSSILHDYTMLLVAD